MLRKTGPLGDMNSDCHVDMIDVRAMQVCFTGMDNPPAGGLIAGCTRGDFDSDGDVDLDDYEEFLDSITGPGDVVPGCEVP